MFRAFVLALPLILTACGGTPPPRRGPVVAPVVRPAPPPPVAPPVIRPRPGPGPIEVIGRDARQLIASFGQPRLDIREPTVRKLQFANATCVMDAYLYAPETGKEPIATHVDARSTNGVDTDVPKCAESLMKK